MPNKTFQEMMSDAQQALLAGREFLRINSHSADSARMTVDILCASLQDLLVFQLPETQQLEPIDFGPNDEDRVKDMFEKVFLAEYECVRKDSGPTTARGMADIAAIEAARTYRTWLKEQEPK